MVQPLLYIVCAIFNLYIDKIALITISVIIYTACINSITKSIFVNILKDLL